MMDSRQPDMWRGGPSPPRHDPTPWHAKGWAPALAVLAVLAVLLAAAVLWLAEQDTLQP